MKMYRSLIAAGLIASGAAVAQTTDDPNNAVNGVNTSPRGSVGAVIGSFPVDPAFSNLPVGLENDGSGNLDLTEIGGMIPNAGVIDTTGAAVTGPTGLSDTGNAIGITRIGGNLAITDTTTAEVDYYDPSYTFVSSFSVAGETTFPEGITTAPFSGNLYVVDGAGGNVVIEYDPSGTLVTTFPINGSSPDGIAFDPIRCTFWIYDSGTDTVRSYDSTFTEIETFPGTAAAGGGGGEGLGVIGNRLYVMDPGNSQVFEFDISAATPAPNAGSLCLPDGSQPVPSLNRMGLVLLTLMMLGVAFVVRSRFN